MIALTEDSFLVLHGLVLGDKRVGRGTLLVSLFLDGFLASSGGRFAELSIGKLPQLSVHYFLNG